MHNFFFKIFGFLIFLILIFFVANFAYAGYQKVAPGDTVTLGEFVYDDNFVATTTAGCVLSIFDPDENLVFSGSMTASSTGWTYYDYSVPNIGPAGVWPTEMTCGSVANGDLIKADKSFMVDRSIQSYIDTATSTLVAEIAKGYTVTLSDFGETTVSTAYKAKLQVLNYASVPTDSDSLPTVDIIDSAGTTQVSGASMTKDSTGTYSYSYSIGASAVGGVWETTISTVINGETTQLTDYWSLSSSPADVQIIEITDNVIPTITADVRIDNMGAVGSDFYYVYCIVSSQDNLCGGGDDIDYASDTAYINAGSYIDLSLTLDEVPTTGTYWFKIKARALGETNWAGSSEQFTAESNVTPAICGNGITESGEDCDDGIYNGSCPSSCSSSCTNNSCGGGGGGGGGGGLPAPPPPPPSPTVISCNGADFNGDGRVNSIDFSIMLAFWQQPAPASNPCIDINKDNIVNSIDFSILLYQWGT